MSVKCAFTATASEVFGNPTDATTNPSLVLKAALDPRNEGLVQDAIEYAKNKSDKPKEQVKWARDRVAVNLVAELLNTVPGLVTLTTDPGVAFKHKRTATSARRLLAMLKEKGVPTDRVLVSMAATWYGIQAAKALELEGIRCNVNLVFNVEAQAAACTESGVTMVSVPVAPGTAWQTLHHGGPESASEDMGVKRAQDVYNYYKKHGYSTLVQATHIMSPAQLVALNGCDKIAANGELAELKTSERVLSPPSSTKKFGKAPNDDRHWYQRMCRDALALDKLHEGIRVFLADQKELDKILKKMFSGPKSKL